jgi:hypothetical protein
MINENYDALLRASKDHKTTYLGDQTKDHGVEKKRQRTKKNNK